MRPPRRQRLGAFPRPRHRGLAPGMAELDRRHRALRLDEGGDAREADRAAASFHRPRQCLVMRPRGSTWVASTQTMPAPPVARAARWAKCQSFTRPSSAEYWHIGDIMMRFFTVTERKVIGRNRCGCGSRCRMRRAFSIEVKRSPPRRALHGSPRRRRRGSGAKSSRAARRASERNATSSAAGVSNVICASSMEPAGRTGNGS